MEKQGLLKFLEVKKFSLILIFQLLLQQALRRFPKTNLKPLKLKQVNTID